MALPFRLRKKDWNSLLLFTLCAFFALWTIFEYIFGPLDLKLVIGSAKLSPSEQMAAAKDILNIVDKLLLPDMNLALNPSETFKNIHTARVAKIREVLDDAGIIRLKKLVFTMKELAKDEEVKIAIKRLELMVHNALWIVQDVIHERLVEHKRDDRAKDGDMSDWLPSSLNFPTDLPQERESEERRPRKD